MPGAAHPDSRTLRQLSALLEHALALDDTQRATWLQRLPPEQQALVPRLTALLARAGADTDDFMRRPLAVPIDAATIEPSVDPPGDQPDDEVGPYRLIRPLGTGGMATVWLAERHDGAYQRRVALKLPLLGWAPGLANRMKRECDILATLEHPHIARLYDAGITANGRPYLAMEFVDGEPIDQFVHRNSLSLEARLRLFMQVAGAVAYAHGRLVVHRDLKPSNVLVTASADVRLLDFGVAKLLSSESTETAALTQFIGPAFTREYASPEQIDGVPLTVATDVYSLGVLLYELLAGARPYRGGSPRRGELDEAVIGDDLPPASQRAMDPATARALRGDLDNVLAKALRRNPDRRYSSVEAFAADIERYLSDEPVVARAPTLRYRTLKFIRRRRLMLAASGSAALALSVGLGAALWQAQEAQRQAATTGAVQELSQTAVDFTGGVLSDVMRSGQPMSLIALAERGAALVERDSGATALERAVAAEHAAAWFSAIDRFDRAEQVLSRALTELPADFDPTALRNLRCQRAAMRATLGQIDVARRELDEVIAASGGDPHSAWNCLQRRTRVALQLGDAAGAVTYAQRALHQFDRSGNRSDVRRALLLASEGFALVIGGQPASADARYEQAVGLLERSGNAESSQTAGVLQDWAVGLRSAGDPMAALARFDRALDIERRQSLSGEASATVQGNRAHALRVLGRYNEAADGFANARRVAHANHNTNQELFAVSGQALIALARGADGEARNLVAEGESLMARGGVAAEGSPARWLRLAQSRLAQRQLDLERADTLLAEVEAMYRRTKARTGALAEILMERATISLRQARLPQAQRHADEALLVARAAQGDRLHSLLTGQAWLVTARVRLAADDRTGAREALRHAVANVEAMGGADHHDLRVARELAAEAN